MSQSPGMEQGNENRGQKRKADEALVSAITDHQQQNSCKLLDELPQELFSHVLSFQAEQDLFSLSTVCSSLLKAVEAFSKRALEEIKTKHKVDDTWEDRIRDLSSIETDMEGPLELPNRYLFWKARRIPLYMLGKGNAGKRSFLCLRLEVLPDGERLVSMGNDKIIRLWNLSTKRSRVIFDGIADEETCGCFCHDECIIAATLDDSVRVFSFDGNCIHHVESPDELHVLPMGVNGNKFFFTYYGGEEIISILDLVTGEVQQRELPWSAETNLDDSFDFHFVVCDNALLALKENSGIHVFDLSNFSLSQFLAGDYKSIAKANDDPSTLVAATEHAIDVLALENGMLSRRFSFPCVQHEHGTRNSVLLVHRSLAHIGRARTMIQVYSILNGELVHTYHSSGSAITATTNGHELFGGFFVGDERDLSCIRAYGLPPSLI